MNIMFDQSFRVVKEELPVNLKHENVIYVFEDVDAASKIVKSRKLTSSNVSGPATSPTSAVTPAPEATSAAASAPTTAAAPATEPAPATAAPPGTVPAPAAMVAAPATAAPPTTAPAPGATSPAAVTPPATAAAPTLVAAPALAAAPAVAAAFAQVPFALGGVAPGGTASARRAANAGGLPNGNDAAAGNEEYPDEYDKLDLSVSLDSQESGFDSSSGQSITLCDLRTVVLFLFSSFDAFERQSAQLCATFCHTSDALGLTSLRYLFAFPGLKMQKNITYF